MDILIESTNGFEKDISRLSEREKTITIQKINDCTDLFATQKANVYRKLRRLPLPSDLNGYESSLYTLRISQKLKVILTVDEDPIFGQVIFTLFRVTKQDDFDNAYKSITEFLYQEMLHKDRERETVQAS
ncbi:MAG: hypothetical protein ACRDBG_07025 [Waterburya sp.]